MHVLVFISSYYIKQFPSLKIISFCIFTLSLNRRTQKTFIILPEIRKLIIKLVNYCSATVQTCGEKLS